MVSPGSERVVELSRAGRITESWSRRPSFCFFGVHARRGRIRVSACHPSRRVTSRHASRHVAPRRSGRSRQRRRWRTCGDDDDESINRRGLLSRSARLTKAHSGYTLHKYHLTTSPGSSSRLDHGALPLGRLSPRGRTNAAADDGRFSNGGLFLAVRENCGRWNGNTHARSLRHFRSAHDVRGCISLACSRRTTVHCRAVHTRSLTNADWPRITRAD